MGAVPKKAGQFHCVYRPYFINHLHLQNAGIGKHPIFSCSTIPSDYKTRSINPVRNNTNRHQDEQKSFTSICVIREKFFPQIPLNTRMKKWQWF
jgi:hypothetical protein